LQFKVAPASAALFIECACYAPCSAFSEKAGPKNAVKAGENDTKRRF